MTDIEKAKKKLGTAIREIAEGYGALKSDSLMNSQEERCADDFEEAAGEWVYELIKKVVLDGAEEDGPPFLVLDTEEDWAGYIITDFLGSE